MAALADFLHLGRVVFRKQFWQQEEAGEAGRRGDGGREIAHLVGS